MIYCDEVKSYIDKEVPELASTVTSPCNIYQTLHLIFDFTKQKISEQNLSVVKKCFGLIEQLYKTGDTKVRHAVENVYVFALENIIYVNCEQKRELEDMMPASLYSVYIQQVIGSNI